jgi:hypothetical protein
MIPHARRDNLLIQEVGGELVIYDRKEHHIHSLNPTTAMVWRHCDGRTSVTEMAGLLARETGLSADENLVWLALKQLHEADLLSDPVPDTDWAMMSRREVVRGLERIGAISLLLPTIASTTAPTMAMAQSATFQACREGFFACRDLVREGAISPDTDCDKILSDCIDRAVGT